MVEKKWDELTIAELLESQKIFRPIRVAGGLATVNRVQVDSRADEAVAPCKMVRRFVIEFTTEIDEGVGDEG